MAGKTSVELDPKKLALAKKLVPSKTLRALLDHALDALIAEARRNHMAAMLGTDFFDGDLDLMRGRKRGRAG
jgi:hypothetical protein